MPYVTKRGARYTGYFRTEDGSRKSAGTFASYNEAFKEALRAEELGVDIYRPAQKLSEYFAQWLKDAYLSPISKRNYAVTFKKHVEPILGNRSVTELTRQDVRLMLERLRKDGASYYVRKGAKALLGSAMQELVEQELISENPTHKIRLKNEEKSHTDKAISSDEYKAIWAKLPNPTSKLLASTLVNTGARFGEVAPLRVRDVDLVADEVHIRQRLTEVGLSNSDNKSRFMVIPGTKGGGDRRVRVSSQLIAELKAHIQVHNLQADDLLFHKSFVCVGARDTDSNPKGYLAKDSWLRTWKQACSRANIGKYPRIHDLRHTHATTLLVNGIDLYEVKERLGHSSIQTTEAYLHRVKSQASKASEATSEFM